MLILINLDGSSWSSLSTFSTFSTLFTFKKISHRNAFHSTLWHQRSHEWYPFRKTVVPTHVSFSPFPFFDRPVCNLSLSLLLRPGTSPLEKAELPLPPFSYIFAVIPSLLPLCQSIYAFKCNRAMREMEH